MTDLSLRNGNTDDEILVIDCGQTCWNLLRAPFSITDDTRAHNLTFEVS